jgi:hypothetical protein
MKRASLSLVVLGLWVAGCSVSTSGPAGEKGAPGTKGDAGTKGEQGEQGETGTVAPSLGVVSPLSVFLDRTSTVEISGVGTAWADGVKVDFGMGITVDKVVVASPTVLVVTITVKDAAAVGTHDITVDDGKTPLTFKGAFTVAAPLVAELKGTQALGSVLALHAMQRDVSTPFDPATQVTVANQSGGQVSGVSPYTLDGLVFVDVKATPGMADIVAATSATTPVVSRAPGAVTVADRKPVLLTANAPVAGKAGNAYESQLFQLDLGDNQIAILTSSAKDPKASPTFYLLPSSGAFKDALFFGTSKVINNAKKDSFYVVFYDAKGGAMYDFDLTPKVGGLELEPNDAFGSASAVQVNLAMYGTIEKASDQDYYSVALNAGQSITATTKNGTSDVCGGSAGGNGKIDTQLTLYNTNGTTIMVQNDDISGANQYCSTVTQAIATTGTYFLKVRNSPSFCSSCTFNYSLEVIIK